MSKTVDVYIIREHENSALTRTIPEQTRLNLFTRPKARSSSMLRRRIGTRSHIDHSVQRPFTKEKGGKERNSMMTFSLI